MRSRDPIVLWMAALGALWLLQAATLGISDDEAYYWVLAQRPALGYAYHPPMVAWSIAAFPPLPGLSRELLTRLPSILFASLTFWLGARWIRAVRLKAGLPGPSLTDLSWLLLPGLAGVAWMAVPDLPLLAGWSLCFAACADPSRRRAPILLAAGSLLGLLSKFSAVLFIGSAAISVLLLAPKGRKGALLGALVLGSIAGMIPTLHWNLENDWASIRYQFLDRHQGGGSWDGPRYIKFWASQLLLAGPALVLGFLLMVLRRRFPILPIAFALPAAVFLVQPAFSDFKPHWALVFWWPMALWIAASTGRPGWLDRLQAGWSIGVILLFSLLTQFPLQGLAVQWWTGRTPDPRMDITNDLVGWKGLGAFLEQKFGPEGSGLPVVGSRYQTASQAAFALGLGRMVTLTPKRAGDASEWPSLDEDGWTQQDQPGKGWPALQKAVLYVADQRYSQPPEFRNSSCAEVGTLSTIRWSIPAREVKVWKCEPKASASLNASE